MEEALDLPLDRLLMMMMMMTMMMTQVRIEPEVLENENDMTECVILKN